MLVCSCSVPSFPGRMLSPLFYVYDVNELIIRENAACSSAKNRKLCEIRSRDLAIVAVAHIPIMPFTKPFTLALPEESCIVVLA